MRCRRNYERVAALSRTYLSDLLAILPFALGSSGFQRGPRLLALLVLLAGGAAGVRAQECEGGLARAQERYRDGAFEEVEAILTACLSEGEATDSVRVQAYRLLALTALRRGDFEAGRVEVLKLLGVNVNYEPDPVLDPPDYVGLVRLVKEQLRLSEADSAAVPAPVAAPPVAAPPIERVAQRQTPPPSPPLDDLPDSLQARGEPPSRDRAVSLASKVRLEGAFGLSHYAGGIDDMGTGLQFGLTYGVTPAFALGLVYEAGQYAISSTPGDSSANEFPPPPPPPGVEDESPEEDLPAESSPGSWLHQTGLVLRATLARRTVHPYAFAGVAAAVGHLDETLRVGVGPRLGIGVEGAVGRRTSVFAEAQGTLAFPALAEDPAGGPGYDRLTSIRAGIRFGLGDSVVPGGAARGLAADVPVAPSGAVPPLDSPSSSRGD